LQRISRKPKSAAPDNTCQGVASLETRLTKVAGPNSPHCYNWGNMATSTIEILPSPEALGPAEKHPKRFGGNAALLVAITLFAAFLRIHGLTFKSFWLDEGLSVEYARLPWHAFVHTIWYRELNMGAYYFLLRYWLLLGHSEAFVRGLSVLFSVATVPLLYALGKRLFNSETALIAAFLLSIHAHHVRYAQEARAYAMVVFLTVLASWLLVSNIQRPSSARWGVYTAVCVLAVYTQFYAGFVVAAHVVALAFLPWGEIPWKALGRHLFCFVCLVLPVANFAVTADLGRISWMEPISDRVLLVLGDDLSGNFGRPLLILVALGIAMALVAARRTWIAQGHTKESRSFAFSFAWLFVPVTTVVLVSLVHPLLVNRYLDICVPPLTLLVAAGIMTLRPNWFRWAGLALISALLILGTTSYYDHDFDLVRQDWRAAESYVYQHAQPGDSIYFYAGAGESPFEFYQRQRNPAPLWPKVLNSPVVPNSNLIERELIPGTDLRSLRPVGDRVWLVFLLPFNPYGAPDTDGARIRAWFAAGRHPVDVHRHQPIDIVLFESDAPQAYDAISKQPPQPDQGGSLAGAKRGALE
jgi:mannosyltransferase